MCPTLLQWRLGKIPNRHEQQFLDRIYRPTIT